MATDSPSQHPVVEALVSDPSSVPELTLLEGLRGRAARDGHIRLYLTLDLQDHVDVPADAVKHQKEVDGATRLWVASAAQVVRGGETTTASAVSVVTETTTFSGSAVTKTAKCTFIRTLC